MFSLSRRMWLLRGIQVACLRLIHKSLSLPRASIQAYLCETFSQPVDTPLDRMPPATEPPGDRVD